MGIVIHRRATFFLGIFIFLLPFFGLPSEWKTILIVLSALVLIALSIRIILPSVIASKIGKPYVQPAPESEPVPQRPQILEKVERLEKVAPKIIPKSPPKRKSKKEKVETVIESISAYPEEEKLQEIE